tara:strand:- start:8966 stop:9442 length:477 start_codon:yes stop_codon:yes gene_type:complete
VNRNSGDAPVKSTVKNLEEIIPTFRVVINSASHLDCYRNVDRCRVSHPTDNLKSHIRLTEVKPTATTTQHLLHRTAKIYINYIEACFHKPRRGWGKVVRIGTHQLPAHRVLLIGNMEILPRFSTLRDFDHKPVEHYLAQRIWCPEATGDDPHWPVAIS